MKYKTKLFTRRNTTIYLKSLENCRQYCRICHTDLRMIRGSIEYRWRWLVHYNSDFLFIIRGSPFVMSSLSNLIKGNRLILVKDDINSEKTRVNYLFPVDITPAELVHVNYSGPRTMFYLAQYIRAQERQQGQQQGPVRHIQNDLLVSSNQANRALIGAEAFDQVFTDDAIKERIFESMFDLDRIARGRLRVHDPRPQPQKEGEEQEEEEEHSVVIFNNGFRTDGSMISLHFLVARVNRHGRIPNSLGDLAYIESETDITNWERGLIELKKKPIGLREIDHIMGIDPGVNQLITLVDADNVQTNESRAGHIWSLSNGEYQARSGTK